MTDYYSPDYGIMGQGTSKFKNPVPVSNSPGTGAGSVADMFGALSQMIKEFYSTSRLDDGVTGRRLALIEHIEEMDTKHLIDPIISHLNASTKEGELPDKIKVIYAAPAGGAASMYGRPDENAGADVDYKRINRLPRFYMLDGDSEEQSAIVGKECWVEFLDRDLNAFGIYHGMVDKKGTIRKDPKGRAPAGSKGGEGGSGPKSSGPAKRALLERVNRGRVRNASAVDITGKRPKADPRQIAHMCEKFKGSRAMGGDCPEGMCDMRYYGYLDKNSSSRKGWPISFFVLHDGGFGCWVNKDGSRHKAVEGAIQTWQKTKNWRKPLEEGPGTTSSHFYIDGNGVIYQLLTCQRTGHAHGCTEGPNSKFPLKYGGPGKESLSRCPLKHGNQRAIAIDLQLGTSFVRKQRADRDIAAGRTKTKAVRRNYHKKCMSKYTDAQYESLNKLLRHLGPKFGIPLDDDHILCHYQMVKMNHYDMTYGSYSMRKGLEESFQWTRVVGCKYNHHEVDAADAPSILKEENYPGRIKDWWKTTCS